MPKESSFKLYAMEIHLLETCELGEEVGDDICGQYAATFMI